MGFGHGDWIWSLRKRVVRNDFKVVLLLSDVGNLYGEQI
jgi:hypothetical protein